MNCKDWFDTLLKNNTESKKIIGFILLWMAFDDKVSQWAETQSEIIKKNNNKLFQIKSFFASNLQKAYNEKKEYFLKSFSEIPGGERYSGNRIGLLSVMDVIYYRNNYKDSNSDAYATVLYKLRNSFFHGSKENNDNNRALICWAFDTLSELLNVLYPDEFLYFGDKKLSIYKRFSHN